MNNYYFKYLKYKKKYLNLKGGASLATPSTPPASPRLSPPTTPTSYRSLTSRSNINLSTTPRVNESFEPNIKYDSDAITITKTYDTLDEYKEAKNLYDSVKDSYLKQYVVMPKSWDEKTMSCTMDYYGPSLDGQDLGESCDNIYYWVKDVLNLFHDYDLYHGDLIGGGKIHLGNILVKKTYEPDIYTMKLIDLGNKYHVTTTPLDREIELLKELETLARFPTRKCKRRSSHFDSVMCDDLLATSLF